MIILCHQKCNTNFKEILNFYSNIYNQQLNIQQLSKFSCPDCGSSSFCNWGYYTRNINYIGHNVLEYKTIKIKRIRCNHCGHTHALIPSFIVPYKVSLLDILLASINNDDITISYSFDTINKWHLTFNNFLPYLKTLFDNSNTNDIIYKFKSEIFYYYKLFYDTYKKIFMMTHKGIFNMSPF